MDKTKLRQQALFMRSSLFNEGFLDEQFIQLEELQDDVNPNFVEEIVTLFYSDSVRLIYNIERALMSNHPNFTKLDDYTYQFKGSCSSIGAKKVKNECTRFREYCAAGNFEGCFRTFQQINLEHTTLKKKLETYFQGPLVLMDVEADKTKSVFRRDSSEELDDDGRIKRTGNVLTATTHIVTVVVGAGVLALAWAIAQLGWLPGISTMIIFACISIYTYNLIADCYRYPDPIHGKRNYTYMQAVDAYLGGTMHVFCGLIQYGKLAGLTVGYTITSSTSLVAIKKAICFHKRGHKAYCKFSNNPYMIGFGMLQILLSQIPNFHKLTWLSTLAAITSFGYAFIGSGLSLEAVVSGKGETSRIFGNRVGPGLSETDKMWRVFSALGNIGLACSYATVVYDIMDTLKSYPEECKQMKKANVLGITTMTVLFLLCGGLGYAAFGDDTPGNILTGFGFYEPFWLVALGNVCIVTHMLGAYQVLAQPLFRIIEMGANMVWPRSDFINKEYPTKIGSLTLSFNLFRLIWRTIYVIVVTIIAMAMPFFNEFLALLGAIGFWPLIVFFPIQMHIAQKQIQKLSLKWCVLQLLSFVCFLVSVVAAVGSIRGISKNVKKYELFMYKQ